MTHNPPDTPPVEQWPLLAAPDCPTCQRPTEVAWIGPATLADGAQVNVWRCRASPRRLLHPRRLLGPSSTGPNCPHSPPTEVTCWAALAPDALGDLWTCEHGHEFVLTSEGLIVLPEDAA